MTLRERGGGGQGVNVIMTFRSAKVVWKCPLSQLLYKLMFHIMLRVTGATLIAGVVRLRPHAISI